MIALAVSFVPLALYFFALAAMNSGRRVRALSGQEDLAATSLGMIGFVMTGPILFFLPIDAFTFWGFYTWFFLAVLYSLIVWFLGTALRFRIVIYNMDSTELRETLTQIAEELDAEARWAGNSLSLPTLGIQFYIEYLAILRNNVLIGTGSHQNLQGWLQFEKTLHKTLLKQRVAPTKRTAIFLASIGLLLGIVAILILITHQSDAFSALQFLLR
ncbi:MAG: hypothetical protein LBJ67_08370 [Planctomycetaceae bacterium]|jgi:hypothetical protein|nr:hypothetical protein [Planctomycetaceae bacterium]